MQLQIRLKLARLNSESIFQNYLHHQNKTQIKSDDLYHKMGHLMHSSKNIP